MINNDTLVDNSQFPHVIWTNCDCNTEVQQYITRDGGHSWPDGVATPMGDLTSEFLNANELMWSFFQSYTLACETVLINTANNVLPLTIFPNPSNDRIRLDKELISSSFKVSIFNSTGVPVFQSNNTYEYDISHLAVGIYIVRVEVDNDIYVGKIIKTQ